MPASPQISLARTIPPTVDVQVLGLTENNGAPMLVGATDAGYRKKELTELLKILSSVVAKPFQHVAVAIPFLGKRVVVAGLPNSDVTGESVRRAVGRAMHLIRKLPADRPLSIGVSLDLMDASLLKGAVEGALLGAYTFDRRSKQPGRTAIQEITLVTAPRAELKTALSLATITAQAVCTAREWVNMPGNELFPEMFAAAATQLAAGSRIDVEVWDEARLTAEGFGGLVMVGGGSAHPPRLVRYSYAPRGANFHLALVGKGVTFDAGGLDLKSPESMYTMKSDMAGAAAVLSAVKAIADLGLKIRVTAYAAMAENLPSGSAFRPSDILRIYGGTTVENSNTDAEGRLIMADALARASADAPDLIVDIATLTGACITALGRRTAGLMASDDSTADLLLDAAESAGESLWQLPLPEETRQMLDSKVADIRSTGKTRSGGALVAAVFLREFVPEEMPWAHLDIAGPAFNADEAYDYVPSGGTGFGVRTLIALARSLQG